MARLIKRRESELRKLSGARALRIVDEPRSSVGEHAHDWPVLSFYVMGGYRNRTALGEARISSAAATFYAAGAAHANLAGEHGFEQIEIEFDPSWISTRVLPSEDPVQLWIGGPVAAAGRALGAAWGRPDINEDELRRRTRRFFELARQVPAARRPPWLDGVVARLQSDPSSTAAQLAADLGLNPAWLAQAYRRAMGEGLRETAARRRVELATTLLKQTADPASEIALAAGFCDQSHMIRTFRAVLGRTPSQLLAERMPQNAVP